MYPAPPCLLYPRGWTTTFCSYDGYRGGAGSTGNRHQYGQVQFQQANNSFFHTQHLTPHRRLAARKDPRVEGKACSASNGRTTRNSTTRARTLLRRWIVGTRARYDGLLNSELAEARDTRDTTYAHGWKMELEDRGNRMRNGVRRWRGPWFEGS